MPLEIRQLIREMSLANPLWGHGNLDVARMIAVASPQAHGHPYAHRRILDACPGPSLGRRPRLRRRERALAPAAAAGGARTVISVDGMDWRRRKWGWAARNLLERSSLLAIRASGACVTDSREVGRWYRSRYGQEPHYIAHGVDTRPVPENDALRDYGLVRSRLRALRRPHHPREGRPIISSRRSAISKRTSSSSLSATGQAIPNTGNRCTCVRMSIRTCASSVRCMASPCESCLRTRTSTSSRPRNRGHRALAGRGHGVRELRACERHRREPRDSR